MITHYNLVITNTKGIKDFDATRSIEEYIGNTMNKKTVDFVNADIYDYDELASEIENAKNVIFALEAMDINRSPLLWTSLEFAQQNNKHVVILPIQYSKTCLQEATYVANEDILAEA